MGKRDRLGTGAAHEDWRLILQIRTAHLPHDHDCEGLFDRQAALELFDAFGSLEKTLNANMGGHTGVPQSAGDAAASFFVRHLM